ncbi:methyltransferase domain-containing protein [candidate division GN15 bacterium]|nr:methyltransferase domain-containing protein [candidate division GN15 bacterium]
MSKSTHVCPWWVGYLLASPVRKWFEQPERLIEPYVKPGQTVLDVGSAMGFFTFPAAKLVGDTGRVLAVDLQPRMISSLNRRIRRRGLADRIETRVCSENDLRVADLAGQVDLVLAIHVLHEVPDARRCLQQIADTLSPGGRVLLLEPSGHVSERDMQEEIRLAELVGLQVRERPVLRRSHAAVLVLSTTA